MEAFDTNVVVRLLVRDDEGQFRRAELVWRRALAGGGAWIATVVLVEVCWVLRSAYRFDRGAITSALRALIATEGVSIEDESVAIRALESFETGTADFADFVILEGARHCDSLPLNTFDDRLARSPGVRLVP